MSIDLFARHAGQLELTAAEKKTIAAHKQRASEITNFLRPFQGGDRSRIKDARFQAEQNLTQGAIDKLVTEVIVSHHREEIAREIRHATSSASRENNAQLVSIARRACATIREGIKTDLAAHLGAIESSPIVSAIADQGQRLAGEALDHLHDIEQDLEADPESVLITLGLY